MMRSLAAAALLVLAACSGETPDTPAPEASARAAIASAPPVETPDAPPAPETPAEASPSASPDTPVPSPAATPSSAAPAPAGPAPASGDPLTGTVKASDPGFKRFPAAYSDGVEHGRTEAVDAFIRMADAAKADGVQLRVVSGFRAFSDQKRIWENKWTGVTRVEDGKLPQTVPDPKARALKILEYSSMPATSRHHWGTDFDINSTSPGHFSSGAGKKTYEWLAAHAAEYGFCQPYTAKGSARPVGYNEEKWHWSYKPVSSPMLAEWKAKVGYAHITGFLGSDVAQAAQVVETYVDGINPDCR